MDPILHLPLQGNTEKILYHWKTQDPNKYCIYNGQVRLKSTSDIYHYEVLPSQYIRGKSFMEPIKLHEYCGVQGQAAGKIDGHHSVFAHNHSFIEHVKNTGKVANPKNTEVMLDWLWLEIDGDTIYDSIHIAEQIIFGHGSKLSYLLNHLQVYWSGNRSIHIGVDGQLFGNLRGSQEWLCGDGKIAYQLAHRLVEHLNNGVMFPYLTSEEVLVQYSQQLGLNFKDINQARKHYEVIDPNLFRVNSTIRMPNTIHPKTNQPKLHIGVTGIVRKKIEFSSYKRRKVWPYLLSLVEMSLRPVEPPRKSSSKSLDLTSDEYAFVFSKFMDLNGHESGDWINGLESPFYEDSNPSVALNIRQGLYKDFGHPDHVFNLEEFIGKMYGCDVVESTKIINDILHGTAVIRS